MAVAGNRPTLLLASQSPRRAMLLREEGIPFDVVNPRYEEPQPFGRALHPAELAEALSYYKARSVAGEHPGRVILGADTVVAMGDQLFGKPADRDDAARILTSLGGTTHQVITGVTLLCPADDRRLIRHDVTRVTMRRMSDDELRAYLDSGEWEGKAGAYGIQDTADQFVEHTEGSFSNVVGLPIELLRTMLAEIEQERV